MSWSHFSRSISSSSPRSGSAGFKRIFALLRWSVTLASNVRIFRSSSAMGPVLVTMLGWTLTVGSPRVSSVRDRRDA